MSELALTLLRLGFLLILWLAVIGILNFMRRDLRLAERRTPRTQAVKLAPEPARKSARLSRVLVTDENGKQTEYSLVDQLTIGRAAESSIQLTDDYASTHHARIDRTEEGWQYTDLGSTNGSWIDRKRVEAPVPLKRNLAIRIGKSSLRFER